MRKNKEHHEQVIVIKTTQLMAKKYPELNLLYAIPNGGARHLIVARKLKAEGVRSGVPDLHLPVARNGFHSLYIEMKIKPNKPTKNQVEFIKLLKDEGNCVHVCYSAGKAIECIESYLQS